MTIEDFLKDPGSTTGYFSTLSEVYVLKILDHGINADKFQRIVAIYLENIPVMLGVSSTQLSHTTFLDILQNAAHVPIGTKLFAVDSGISRTNMQVRQIPVDTIANKAVNDFLANLTNLPDQLYFRQSDFVYENQSMRLDEYVLPGLINLLAKAK